MFGLDDMAIGTIVSAGIGAASNVLGSKSNSKNAADTNNMNLQIARENNLFNQQMWDKNNAYNDPSAQKERLLKAGINPYVSASNGGSGVSTFQSKPVEGTMPSPMQPTMPGNALIAAGSSISNGVNLFMNQQLMAAQVKKANADANTAAAQAKLATSQADKIAGVDTDLAHQNIENTAYKSRLISLQADAQEIQNRVNDVFASPIAKAQLSKIQADVAAQLATRQLTDAEVNSEVQKAINLAASTNKIHLESYQISTLLPYLVTQYKLSNIGQANANALSGNEVQFQNSSTMPNNSFGMREKAAGLKSAELGVQLGGVNIDKATAETYKITQESKLIRKENQFYVINSLGKLIPLTLLVK